jgi:hypothetical protein
VNTPKKILFGLAWLYNIESEIQRKSMVEWFIQDTDEQLNIFNY